MCQFHNETVFPATEGVLCVWPATIIEESQYPDFIEFVQDIQEGIEVIPLKTLVTTEGREDFFFEVRGTLGAFILQRIPLGIKWFEDFREWGAVYKIDDKTVKVEDL